MVGGEQGKVRVMLNRDMLSDYLNVELVVGILFTWKRGGSLGDVKATEGMDEPRCAEEG